MMAVATQACGMLELLQQSAAAAAAEATEQQQQQRPPELIEHEVLLRFQQLWQQQQAVASACAGVQQRIPQLFTPAPAPGSIKARVLQQACARKLQSQRSLLLDDGELEALGALLARWALPPTPAPGSSAGSDPEEPRINYDGLVQAHAEVLQQPYAAAAAPFFRPSTFLRLERDGAGAVSLPLLLQYISLSAVGQRLRLQLAEFDEAGSGLLELHQLQAYLAAVAGSAPALADMEPSFLPHYLQIASRKFLLFHGRRVMQPRHGSSECSASGSKGCSSSAGGSGGGGRLVVRIADLVGSPVMAELQELLLLGPGAEQERDMFSNWFSLQSAQRVLATFTSWDHDASGSLSRQEFSAISQGAMTELFISRVFEEHVAPQRGAAWPPQPAGAAAAGGEPASEGGPGCASPPLSPARCAADASADDTRGGGSPGRAGGSSLPSIHAAGKGSPSKAAAGSAPPGSPAAAGRPAAACSPARDEMDLLAFADFVLAWDHRHHPAAVPYFFRILDIHHRGFLTLPDLYTFFREVKALWVGLGEYAELDVYDVLDEVADMVSPVAPGRITMADLAASKVSGTVFSILANVDQFYQYNYRENFMHAEGGEAAAPEA